MSIDFTCRNCSTTLRVPEEHLGKQARCPKCQMLCEVRPDSEVQFLGADQQPGVQFSDPVQPVKSEYEQSKYVQGAAAARDQDYSRPVNHNPNQNSPYGAPAAQRRNYSVAHRGGLVLTMGILSLFCNFAFVPGILAWVFGRADLKQMEAGVMDNEGQGLTQAGMYIGIVMTCLPLVGIALYMLFIFFMIMVSLVAG